MKTRGGLLPRPQDLPPVAAKYWDHVENLLDGLLNELKAGDWILSRGEFSGPVLFHLAQILLRYNLHVDTSKSLVTAFLHKARKTRRALLNLNVGFTRNGISHLFIFDSIGVFVESTEIIRNHLLVIIRKKKPFNPTMTLGQLVAAFEQTCPQFGPKFAAEINVPLRNAFAHGNYWLQKGSDGVMQLAYTEKLGQKAHEDIQLPQIVELLGKHTTFSACLATLLFNKSRAGYFGS